MAKRTKTKKTTRRKKSARSSGRSTKTYVRLRPAVKKKASKIGKVFQWGFIVLTGYFIITSISSNLRWEPWKPKPAQEKIMTAQSTSVAPLRAAPEPKQQAPVRPPDPLPQVRPRRVKPAPVPPVKLWQPPSPKPPRTFSSRKPKIVFVIDDIGHTNEHLSDLKVLGDRVTYAILPLLTHSKFFSTLSTQTGAEVILHLPFEARDGTVPGPGLLTSRMSTDHVRNLLNRDFLSVPHAVGVNNHMGSKGTADPKLMRTVLETLKKQDLFFLDSQTTAGSTGPIIGKQLGLPVLKRDVFLDNEDSRDAIREQVQKLESVARRQGYAVGIGHYRKNTLRVLGEEIERLEAAGIEIISLRDLLNFLG